MRASAYANIGDEEIQSILLKLMCMSNICKLYLQMKTLTTHNLMC